MKMKRIPKSLENSESSSKRKTYNTKCLHKEIEICKMKNLMIHLRPWKNKNKPKPKATDGKASSESVHKLVSDITRDISEIQEIIKTCLKNLYPMNWES